jgi:hypothetical protein
MFIIVLNQTNLVPDGQNNKLIYNFPNSVNLKDKYIAVSSVSMYYSWFNITSAFSNNTFSYTWTAGTTTTTYTITIPDGLYQIVDINSYIQFICIKNATYWTISGVNYYPFEMLINAPIYAIQINTYLIPTSLPSGATIPTGFPGWPTTTQNSVITIPSNFNNVIGFTAGFTTYNNIGNPSGLPVETNYVSKNQSTGTISYTSTLSPQLQQNNNVLFSISNINNPYAQPSSIIYSLNPNVAVGEQIIDRPPNFMWNKLIDGTYNQLRLTLLGTNLQPLLINDPNMTILLTIRDKDETSISAK